MATRYLFLLIISVAITQCTEIRADPEASENARPLLDGEYTEKKTRTLSPECARVVMVNYPCMDLKAALAECCKDINEQHNQIKDELFGSMNELLLAHNKRFCSNSKMMQGLGSIPTSKGTKLNAFYLLCRQSPKKLVKMMDECPNNTNNFIRGIDSSSNLPFLLFVLMPFCTQLPFKVSVGVAVLFNEKNIEHTIIADSKQVYKISDSLSIQNIVHFMKHGELKNDLGFEPVTKWIHLRDEAWKLRERKRNNTALIVLCLSIVASMLVYFNLW